MFVGKASKMMTINFYCITYFLSLLNSLFCFVHVYINDNGKFPK